jgi:hypothetical protein
MNVIVGFTTDSDVATALYRYLAARAQALIAAKWPYVEKVAAALLEREELNGREVGAIILQTMREDFEQMKASK